MFIISDTEAAHNRDRIVSPTTFNRAVGSTAGRLPLAACRVEEVIIAIMVCKSMVFAGTARRGQHDSALCRGCEQTSLEFAHTVQMIHLTIKH